MQHLGQETEPFAAVFHERGLLLGLSYRLLGTVADAEDCVQESYLRWLRLGEGERASIRNPRAWLIRVASRIALDMLRSARSRREQYVGEWLPEPLPDTAQWTSQSRGSGDPAERVDADESLSLLVLTLLERLTPAERVSFVLAEVFQFRFAEIGEIVGRTPAACRQLASVARAKLRAAHGASAPERSGRDAVEAFRDAWQGGNLRRMIESLDPSVRVDVDGGGRVSAARAPIHGAFAVANELLRVHEREPSLRLVAAAVNGDPGIVARDDEGRALAVIAPCARDTTGFRRILVVRNPEKLLAW